MAELDRDEVLARGLRGYVRLVTEALDLDSECSYVWDERPARAYLAVDRRLPTRPDREAALLWDEERGWSAAIETHSGEDLIIVDHLGGDVLPPPRRVAKWAGRLFRGERRDAPRPVPARVNHAAGDLTRRLAAYADAVPVPMSRSA
ncbi:hypothetical protein ALI22I_07920 [Saccharothrix sp. ALI-22-I]|uniref:DUF6292 family protein n=1 Tax=Saccharothrix sp. ALI-22-I TaxID=1933778 RepID=UPI00097BB172|nr:DUF6292 family protein [Saccharothrix sp. ALI-22-I]ONI91551.1 hypothetical protein ALI22I_07920 [Saccharothrix sp. ALI-22-I]